jgi:hypothetical protein
MGMASRDRRLQQLDRLLELYRQGAYTELEVAGYCIDVADSTMAAELLRSLPPDVLRRVEERVDEAPTSEEGWASMELITFRSDPEPALSQAERVSRHRASIEAIRRVLNDGPA